jgi:acetoin:2,6-dichlorophenolindophenol oxidoreductase subunit alpha
MPVRHISTWAAAHGIEAVTVDGNDVEGVHAAACKAVASIRATGRPYFLELDTYRLRGHFEPDDQSYVDPAELASWRARDPIDAMTKRLLGDGVIATGELEHLKQRVEAVIEAAAAFADASAWPQPSELTTDVYA